MYYFSSVFSSNIKTFNFQKISTPYQQHNSKLKMNFVPFI